MFKYMHGWQHIGVGWTMREWRGANQYCRWYFGYDISTRRQWLSWWWKVGFEMITTINKFRATWFEKINLVAHRWAAPGGGLFFLWGLGRLMCAEGVRGLVKLVLRDSEAVSGLGMQREWFNIQCSCTSLALFSTEYIKSTVYLAEMTKFCVFYWYYYCRRPVIQIPERHKDIPRSAAKWRKMKKIISS